VRVVFGHTGLVGSTVELSEGGLRCVFRPHGDLGNSIPFPKAGQPSDWCWTTTPTSSRRRSSSWAGARAPTQLHEWSLTFTAMPEAAQDLVRSHVFTALRNARARGLAT
jgi:hypothetical protein